MKLVSPRQERTISGPRKKIESAIAASTGRTGTSAQPKVAAASVIEWATVKAVIVFTSIQRSFTIRSSPKTNRRWSGPKRDVADPVDDVGAEELHPRLFGRDLDPGLRRPHDRRPRPAVEQLDPHEDVGDRRLQPRELDALPGETRRTRRRSSGARGASRRAAEPTGSCGSTDALRKLQADGQAHAREDGRLPEKLVAPGRRSPGSRGTRAAPRGRRATRPRGRGAPPGATRRRARLTSPACTRWATCRRARSSSWGPPSAS